MVWKKWDVRPWASALKLDHLFRDNNHYLIQINASPSHILSGCTGKHIGHFECNVLIEITSINDRGLFDLFNERSNRSDVRRQNLQWWCGKRAIFQPQSYFRIRNLIFIKLDFKPAPETFHKDRKRSAFSVRTVYFSKEIDCEIMLKASKTVNELPINLKRARRQLKDKGIYRATIAFPCNYTHWYTFASLKRNSFKKVSP